MISGIHTILYSRNADAVRAFFRDVLKFRSVDAGSGWLIFAAPPAEIAVHPTEEHGSHELYLMCGDINRTVAMLKAKGVEFIGPITDERWGLLTHLRLPDGETLGLYEPRHPTAIGMRSTSRTRMKLASAKRTRVSPSKTRRR